MKVAAVTSSDVKSNNAAVATKAQRSKNTTLIPCRARGMPTDHTFKNAHFVIPNDIVHGTDIRCSHKACASQGVKFKFCSYCWMPVAKRNFNRRHGNESSIAHKGICEGVCEREEKLQSYPIEESSSLNCTSTKKSSETYEISQINAAKGMIELKRGSPLLEKIPSSLSPTRTENESVGIIQDEWMKLLSQRPSGMDNEEMKQWLLKVLGLSELVAPTRHDKERKISTTKNQYKDSNNIRELKLSSRNPEASTIDNVRISSNKAPCTFSAVVGIRLDGYEAESDTSL